MSKILKKFSTVAKLCEPYRIDELKDCDVFPGTATEQLFDIFIFATKLLALAHFVLILHAFPGQITNRYLHL